MTSKQTQVRSTEEALSAYDTLKLALEALKKSDGFLYNWHENYSDDEADAYAAARQLNEQAIIAAEKALMSLQDGAQPEQEPTKLWCETCEGTGEVYQEHQAGCHVGGHFKCPDCDGEGYVLSRLYSTTTTQPKEPEHEPVAFPDAPQTIYLQVGDECPEDAKWKELVDVCWCDEQVFDNDIVYVRADTTPPTQQNCSQRPSRSDMTWVGLTHEDIDKAIEDNQRFGGFRKVGFAYDLELVLKEKNT